MLWVIGCLLLGMVLGLLIRKRNTLQKPVDKIAMFLVYVLLFVLGLSAGSNDNITRQFHHLGLTAIIISLFTTAGSIIGGWIVYKLFFVKGIDEE